MHNTSYLALTGELTMTTFADVKTILDGAIAGWKAAHGGNDPDLIGAHQRDPAQPFGWSSKAELLSSFARRRQLIQPGVKGKDTNLVIALVTGLPPFPRMPNDGPFLAQADIDTIAAWIDAGCPD
jgi:hypothetical protein